MNARDERKNYIRKHCAVFENGRAQLGWVEIQRNDESGGFASDAEAARAAARFAYMHNCILAGGRNSATMVPAYAAWRVGLITRAFFVRAHQECT